MLSVLYFLFLLCLCDVDVLLWRFLKLVNFTSMDQFSVINLWYCNFFFWYEVFYFPCSCYWLWFISFLFFKFGNLCPSPYYWSLYLKDRVIVTIFLLFAGGLVRVRFLKIFFIFIFLWNIGLIWYESLGILSIFVLMGSCCLLPNFYL